MSVRSLLLIVVAIGLFAAIPWIVRRNSLSARAARSSITIPSHYRCLACKHEFDMDQEDATRQVREGKTLSEPGRLRKFTCPHCGKIEAVIYASTPAF